MPDVISQLHRLGDTLFHLFDQVEAGGVCLSIQASEGHSSVPQISDLPAYMYDEFEVLLCGGAKPPFGFRKKFDPDGIGRIKKSDLQRLYDTLEVIK
jgi:hypothetical protein